MTKNDTKTQNNQTPPSTLCSACSALVKSSDLEWVQCGGMNVGMHRQPLVWRLRDKYSSDVIQMNAEYSQRLAAATKLVHSLKKHVNDPEMLERMERFLKQNAK